MVTASLGIFGSVSSNVYQTVRSATVTPSTVQQGQTFTSRFTPTASGIPRLQSSSAGDATVNNMSRMAAVIPIPSGMTFVSARTYGGDSVTSGVATVTYCTTFSTSLPCRASSPTGNFVHSSAPYLIVALPDAVTLPGGSQVSLPNVEVTLTATGPVGTVAQWKLTEFRTRISASLIIGVTTDFIGYPTDDSNEGVAPPVAPPAILATNEIVG